MKISGMVLCGKYEPYLKYCLESIKDICDEIYVFVKDIGVMEDIKTNCFVVEQEGDETDFSKWRNEIVDISKGDWILMLDADEILAFSNGAPVTRNDIENIIASKDDALFYGFATRHFVWNYFTLDGRHSGVHWSMRLFQKTERRFKRKVHEFIDIKEGEQFRVMNPLIWHFGHCKGMEDLREKYAKTGKVSDNPYGIRNEEQNNGHCARHEWFRGVNVPLINYSGPLPKVMRLW